MHAQLGSAPFHPLWIVAAIAALLIGAAGTAISMVGNPTATTGVAAPLVTKRSSAAAADAAAATRGNRRNQRACAECGVIESMHVFGVLDADEGIPPSESMQVAAGGNDRGRRETSIARYEYVVRLRDGSRHVLAETTPRDWVPGARINLIAGAADLRR